MPSRHVIHLGDAWEPPVAAGDRNRFVRRFGRPSGLESGNRVLLVVSDPAVSASVVVNETPLPDVVGGAVRWEYDITPLLRERNELVLLIGMDSDADARMPGAPGTSGRLRLPAASGAVTIEIVAAG